MIRNPGDLKKEVINVAFCDGGLGDNICRLPAIKYIHDNYPNVYQIVWAPDFFVELAKNSLPKSDRIQIQKFSNQKNYNVKFHSVIAKSLLYTTMATHLVDHGFQTIADRTPNPEDRNYIPLRLGNVEKFNLPEKYVVITTGYTAIVREWKAQSVNEVVSYCKQQGYEAVFLGSTQASTGDKTIGDLVGSFNEEIDYSQGINLIDRTSLLDAGSIISGAKVVIGVDNGLIHLAGMTDVKILCGYTTTKPLFRLPIRNNVLGYNCWSIEPPETLKCRGCQSNWSFVYDHDYKECYYVSKKMDTEIQCTKSLTSDLFIDKLKEIL